ncbi:transcriptional regulator, MerR family [Alkaliphilus oremlandii OhILAs]|uniref:Transcriptional regulator, MerR family n=2 Tax=Alkaliphilus oremlandii TaxID=461876 RepID=A8MKH2_ALKOO|nr:transcriptional regulator, MerR family [Alkaliphilus oremlandii OhILAs]
MFKIGMFSQLVRVSPRMLRHYEKCGLFYPAEIDKINGYRLYSSSQIPLILRIVALRDMGFSIQEIGDILDNFEEQDNTRKIFQEKSKAIQESISNEMKKMDLLNKMYERIEKGNYTITCGEVILKTIPSIQVLSLRETISDYSYQEALWEKMYAYIGNNDLYTIIENDVIVIYHDTEYKEQDIDIEIAVPVKELRKSTDQFIFKELEPIALAASVICEGSYDKTLPEGETMLAKWIEDNGYEIVGSERAYGLCHPGNEQDPDKYQTEIQFPIVKKHKKER